MKKVFLYLAAILLLGSTAKAQMGIGVFGGLSTPNDEINNVYNTNRFDFSNLDSYGELAREGVKTGYHFGLRARLPLTNGLMLNGGIAWNRFPETKLDITDPSTGKHLVTLETVQDLIPISAGFSYYLINSGIGVYALGELSYNINKNTVNTKYNGTQVPLNLDDAPSYNRIGAGFGAGMDVNLFFFLANIEARYNYANLIGRDDGEEMKSYFTLSIGVYLGSSSSK